MSASATDFKKDDKNNIKRNASDLLGIEFSQYKQRVYAKSITNPSEYFQVRNTMETQLKEVLVTHLYDTVYNVLRYGILTDTAGKETPICIDDLAPGYPSNLVSDECLKLSSTMNEIVNDIINIIHPSDYESLAANQMKIKARAIGL